MTGILGTYRNLILKGGLAAIPHPTLFTGTGTFIDKTSVFGGSVVEGSGFISRDAPAYNYFFDNLAGTVDDIFGNIWLHLQPKARFFNVDKTVHGHTVLQLLDMQRNQVKRIHLAKGKVVKDWRPASFSKRYQKFPFVCGDSKDNNWGLKSTNGKKKFDFTASFVYGGLFESKTGAKVGNDVCRALSKVIPRLPPSDLGGNPRSHLIKKRGNEHNNCNRAITLKSPSLMLRASDESASSVWPLRSSGPLLLLACLAVSSLALTVYRAGSFRFFQRSPTPGATGADANIELMQATTTDGQLLRTEEK